MSKRIPYLNVAEDPGLRELLEYNVQLNGFEVHVAPDIPSRLKIIQEKNLAAIL